MDGIEQDRERFDMTLVDPSGGQIVRLPPRQRCAVHRPPLFTPCGHERLQRRGLSGARCGDHQPEPAAMAEAFDRRSLRLAMFAREIQTRRFDLATKQSLR